MPRSSPTSPTTPWSRAADHRGRRPRRHRRRDRGPRRARTRTKARRPRRLPARHTGASGDARSARHTTPPGRRDTARCARSAPAVVAPSRGRGRAPCRRVGRHRERHGVGKDALLPDPDRRRDRERNADDRAARLPHEGARAGPGAAVPRMARPGGDRGDVRRRHGDRRPGRDPTSGERPAHEPGDAPHGHPPVARAVGDLSPPAPVRRRRRAPHVARDLREPHGAGAAPAAASVRALRIGSHVLLLERDDREPRGAGVDARRAPGHRDHQRRRASLSPRLRLLAASARRPARGDAQLGQRGDRRHRCALRARRSPDTGLHPESQGIRARRRAGTRPARGVVPRLRRTGPSGRRLPRRLPRGGAPGAGAGARGPDPRWCRGDERARARHRRRRASTRSS